MQDDISGVLDFWIDEIGPAGWYVPADGLDQKIADRFGTLAVTARAGQLGAWTASARGTLALLCLLDQFPRNIWRGTAEAFASDALGRAYAKAAIRRGQDLLVAEPERQFMYMPLMHSESLADQEHCVRMFMLNMPEHGDKNLPHAVQHRDVIRRFGRFPSRNAALGRTDSAAERAYRAQGGYMS